MGCSFFHFMIMDSDVCLKIILFSFLNFQTSRVQIPSHRRMFLMRLDSRDNFEFSHNFVKCGNWWQYLQTEPRRWHKNFNEMKNDRFTKKTNKLKFFDLDYFLFVGIILRSLISKSKKIGNLAKRQKVRSFIPVKKRIGFLL